MAKEICAQRYCGALRDFCKTTRHFPVGWVLNALTSEWISHLPDRLS